MVKLFLLKSEEIVEVGRCDKVGEGEGAFVASCCVIAAVIAVDGASDRILTTDTNVVGPRSVTVLIWLKSVSMSTSREVELERTMLTVQEPCTRSSALGVIVVCEIDTPAAMVDRAKKTNSNWSILHASTQPRKQRMDR